MVTPAATPYAAAVRCRRQDMSVTSDRRRTYTAYSLDGREVNA